LSAGGAPVAARPRCPFPAIREKIESAPKIDRLIDKKAIKINLLRSITNARSAGSQCGV
jgi:hypothetical protein